MWHANYTLEYFFAAIKCTSPATVSPEENKRKSMHGHYMVTSAYAKCSAQCGAGCGSQAVCAFNMCAFISPDRPILIFPITLQ